MKKINFLLFILTILVAGSCNDDNPVEPTDDNKMSGVVSVPSNIEPSNITITNFRQEKEVTEEGQFDLTEINTVAAVNNVENHLIYIGFPDKSERENYVLNAKETALFLAIKVIPFAFREENNEIIKGFKTVIYDNVPEVSILENAIDNSVSTNGYLKMDDIESQATAATEALITLLELDKNNPLKSLATANSYALQIKENEDENDVQISNTEWQVTRDFFSKYQCFLGFTVGDYLADGTANADPNDILGFVKPYNMGAFYDNTFSLSTWKQYFSDLSQTMFYNINHNPTWDATKTSIKFNVRTPDKDAMVFIAPQGNKKVLLYNMTATLIDYFGAIGSAIGSDDFFDWLLSEHPEMLNHIVLQEWNEANFNAFANIFIEHFKDFLNEKVTDDLINFASDNALEDINYYMTLVKPFGNLLGMILEISTLESFHFPVDFDGKALPNVPVLASPVHNSILNNQSDVTLSWSATHPQNKPLIYTLYVGSSLNNLQPILEDTQDESYTLSLNNDSRYIWKVVVSDGSYSAESPIWTFDNGTVSFAIPTNNLVAYYPFNGNANDESVNGYNGTVVGSSFTSGYKNNCIEIGNNDVDRVIIPASTLDNVSDFSISFWTNINQFHTLSHKEHNFINVYNDNYDNNFRIFYHVDNDGFRTIFGDANSDNNTPISLNTVNSHLFNTNNWYHITVIRDGNFFKWFLNGTLIKQGNCSTIPLNAQTIVLGQDQDCNNGCYNSSQSLVGKIDELRIYNRVLQQSEIQALYNE